MSYLRLFILSLSTAYCYYVLTISAIGIAAARKIFWWFEWESHFHFYHIAQNFVGIGVAALVPAYLVHSYEADRKWLAIGLIIALSMMFLGNINYQPWEPAGIFRFVEQMLFFGDLGAIGVFLEIVLLPILWLVVFERMKNPLTPSRGSRQYLGGQD